MSRDHTHVNTHRCYASLRLPYQPPHHHPRLLLLLMFLFLILLCLITTIIPASSSNTLSSVLYVYYDIEHYLLPIASALPHISLHHNISLTMYTHISLSLIRSPSPFSHTLPPPLTSTRPSVRPPALPPPYIR